ncbi:uncharacterized protein LOC135287363 isoform X2 [Passer domesticus]|uniref:uncharacterized protein LOC135287363 isoform X2 n=1 Tax=Passer domesticus TaxID=48849 RepID=UPI0030FF38BF
MASTTKRPPRGDFQESCWVSFSGEYLLLPQPCFLLSRPEIIKNQSPLYLSQAPLGGLSPKLPSAGMCRKGWASVVAASLRSSAIKGKKSFLAQFEPLSAMFPSVRDGRRGGWGWKALEAAEGGCLCRLVPPRRGRMSLGAERAAAAGAWCAVEPGTFWPAQMYDPAFWRAPVAGVPSGVQLSLGRSGLPRYMIQHFWKSPWLQVGVVYVRCAVEPGTFWPAQMYDPAFWRAPVAGVPSGVQLSLGRSGLPRYMIQHFWKSPWLQVGVVYVRCAVEPGTFWPAQMYDPAFWRAPVAGVPSGVQLSLGRSGLPRCMIQHFGESPWLGFPEGFVRCAVEPGMFWPTRMYDPAFWRAPVAGGPAEVCQVGIFDGHGQGSAGSQTKEVVNGLPGEDNDTSGLLLMTVRWDCPGVRLSLGRSGLPGCMIQHFWRVPMAGGPSGVCQVSS